VRDPRIPLLLPKVALGVLQLEAQVCSVVPRGLELLCEFAQSLARLIAIRGSDVGVAR
jgi:hypothetical protein